MNVWIESPFDSLPIEGYRKQRYWMMAEAFVRAGHSVVYWTSDFSHATKRRREAKADVGLENLRLIQIPTRPYPRNVCLRRILSHRAYARAWERMAVGEVAEGRCARPDVIIVSAPPVSTGPVAVRLSKHFGARLAVDVQDAWPETFYRLAPSGLRWIVRLGLTGLRRTVGAAYRQADLLTGVCDRYEALVRGYGAAAPYYRAYLGIETEKDAAPASGEEEKPRRDCREIRLAYVGNLGKSYDLKTVREGLALLNRCADTRVTLDVAGFGGSVEASDGVRFHGMLDQDGLRRLLSRCDVGIIPMTAESFVGIPNKLAEYVRAGLRVVSSLQGETERLLAAYGCGVTYRAKSAESFADAVRTAAKLPAEASRALANGELAADRIYAGYCRRVCRLVEDVRGRTAVHLLAGLGEASGVANIARRFVREQRERGGAAVLLAPALKWNPVYFGLLFAVRAAWCAWRADEIWVHCSWTFPVWHGALLARLFGKRLVVVPEASFDPKRLNNSAGWKKRLVAPLDRRVLRQADEVLALCPDEIGWVRDFEPAAKVRLVNVPVFYDGVAVKTGSGRGDRSLRVLFLGRAEDPLKGVRFLELAVGELKDEGVGIELRVESSVFGEEKERAWEWCDVFCLPTLSDNFGLVVAEALEHGKPVVTTDGASAWDPEQDGGKAVPAGVTYLRGYRDGTDESRVRLLKDALLRF